MSDRHQELHDLTLAFLDAFNRNDLDAVMDFFTDDIVYEELNGKVSHGRAAVRAAFAPQFAGRFGRMTFIEDDTFVDAAAGKVMSSWDLRVDKADTTLVLEGLDLLTFAGRRINRKRTYVKAERALYVAQSEEPSAKS